ncbi:hypothetical protein ACWC9T_40220 [Kitasatospora sp. NPDC001159]
METIGSTGLQGRPWPEVLPDRRPVLVVVAAPGRPLSLEDNWADRDPAPVLATGPWPGCRPSSTAPG